LTAGTLVICPWLGRAKQRIGEKLGSRATYGEGTQNVLCAILAGAVLVGLAANTLFGLWWLDPVIALAISTICVREGQKAWRGEECGCTTCS
jgi:divalent metal cation (Fe/Co/Zn/Cd) transporter